MESEPIKIEVVQGPEGKCVYINDFRVAGPKPWGGGRVLMSWTTTREELGRSMGQESDDV